MSNKNLELGECYHSGMAYAIGYCANGELELGTELFTNLNAGIDGGAMKAFVEDQEFSDKLDLDDNDIDTFLVALKPVKIIRPNQQAKDECDEECCEDCDDDDYECEVRIQCGENDDDDDDDSGCGCGCDPDDDFVCCECGYDEQECECDEVDDYDDQDNDNDDEFDKEFISDTFKHMSAFHRARWTHGRNKK